MPKRKQSIRSMKTRENGHQHSSWTRSARDGAKAARIPRGTVLLPVAAAAGHCGLAHTSVTLGLLL